MTQPEELLRADDGLLIVDVQNDFFPGWNLPVDGADIILPVLNDWITAAEAKAVPIYASRDWHPLGHPSFRGTGGPWPVHCLQDTPGAAFYPELKLPDNTVKVTKGVRFDHDQNSAFDETGLAEALRRSGMARLWVGGLALDVCVLATVLDACEAGFAVGLIRDATRPVKADGGEAAIEQMQSVGVWILEG